MRNFQIYLCDPIIYIAIVSKIIPAAVVVAVVLFPAPLPGGRSIWIPATAGAKKARRRIAPLAMVAEMAHQDKEHDMLQKGEGEAYQSQIFHLTPIIIQKQVRTFDIRGLAFRGKHKRSSSLLPMVNAKTDLECYRKIGIHIIQSKTWNLMHCYKYNCMLLNKPRRLENSERYWYRYIDYRNVCTMQIEQKTCFRSTKKTTGVFRNPLWQKQNDLLKAKFFAITTIQKTMRRTLLFFRERNQFGHFYIVVLHQRLSYASQQSNIYTYLQTRGGGACKSLHVFFESIRAEDSNFKIIDACHVLTVYYPY